MEFWKDIWSKPTRHKENAEWLHDLKEEEFLSMFGVAENVKDLLTNSMKEWSTMLTSCGEEIGEVKFSRGIF